MLFSQDYLSRWLIRGVACSIGRVFCCPVDVNLQQRCRAACTWRSTDAQLRLILFVPVSPQMPPSLPALCAFSRELSRTHSMAQHRHLPFRSGGVFLGKFISSLPSALFSWTGCNGAAPAPPYDTLESLQCNLSTFKDCDFFRVEVRSKLYLHFLFRDILTQQGTATLAAAHDPL